jgi:hypothetical protein
MFGSYGVLWLFLILASNLQTSSNAILVVKIKEDILPNGSCNQSKTALEVILLVIIVTWFTYSINVLLCFVEFFPTSINEIARCHRSKSHS